MGTFVDSYPMYIYKTIGFVNKEQEEQRMKQDIEDNFPFSEPKFNAAILETTLNFLSESHSIGPFKTYSDGSRKAIEKVFMYVCTAERDCFLNSMRMITLSDLKYFE